MTPDACYDVVPQAPAVPPAEPGIIESVATFLINLPSNFFMNLVDHMLVAIALLSLFSFTVAFLVKKGILPKLKEWNSDYFPFIFILIFLILVWPIVASVLYYVFLILFLPIIAFFAASYEDFIKIKDEFFNLIKSTHD